MSGMKAHINSHNSSLCIQITVRYPRRHGSRYPKAPFCRNAIPGLYLGDGPIFVFLPNRIHVPLSVWEVTRYSLPPGEVILHLFTSLTICACTCQFGLPGPRLGLGVKSARTEAAIISGTKLRSRTDLETEKLSGPRPVR